MLISNHCSLISHILVHLITIRIFHRRYNHIPYLPTHILLSYRNFLIFSFASLILVAPELERNSCIVSQIRTLRTVLQLRLGIRLVREDASLALPFPCHLTFNIFTGREDLLPSQTEIVEIERLGEEDFVWIFGDGSAIESSARVTVSYCLEELDLDRGEGLKRVHVENYGSAMVFEAEDPRSWSGLNGHRGTR